MHEIPQKTEGKNKLHALVIYQVKLLLLLLLAKDIIQS